MTGNGTARGRIIPTLAVRTMAAASPAERSRALEHVPS
jgi:hypothetical protein